MSDNERLSRELRNRATQAGGHPISLDDVKRSANKMKWQQRAAAIGVAGVVLAIAVPVGLAFVNNGDDSNGGTNVVTSPSVATPSETPKGGNKVDLTANIEGMGGEPQIPYWFDGAINLPTGERVETPAAFQRFGPLGDGYVGISNEDGTPYVYFLDADGTVTQKIQSFSYAIAFSGDRSQVAYTDKDANLFVAWDGEGSPRQIDTDGVTPVDPVSVVGSGKCVDPETEAGDSCTVYWMSEGESFLSSAHGIVEQLKGVKFVTDVASDGRIAGVTGISDDGACSAVLDESFTKLWKTCDFTLGRFSPDGKYIIGKPKYLDGIGDGSVSVLDAATGEVMVTYDAVDNAFINNTVWESDSTLLTSLYDEGWAIMRLGVDGTLSKGSSGRIAGAAEDTPVFFQTMP